MDGRSPAAVQFSGLEGGAAGRFRHVRRSAAAFTPAVILFIAAAVTRPGYFETMRIPLLRGRLFTEAENRKDAPRTFIVNQTLARQQFGNADPLGQSLVADMGDSTPGRIVGVVADTRYDTLDSEIRPMMYYIQAQLPVSFGTFVMRARGKPELMASAMVAAIQQVKTDQPVSDLRSMDDWIGRTRARARFQTALIAVFAWIALALAAIGVYGVMAYAVEQRAQEIGVRLALGAEPGALKRWIAGQGLRLAAAGLTLGVAVAATPRVCSARSSTASRPAIPPPSWPLPRCWRLPVWPPAIFPPAAPRRSTRSQHCEASRRTRSASGS